MNGSECGDDCHCAAAARAAAATGIYWEEKDGTRSRGGMSSSSRSMADCDTGLGAVEVNVANVCAADCEYDVD